MSLLYIDASPRGSGVSRTLALAGAFFDALKHETPNIPIRHHRLSHMRLMPIDGEMLARREALIDARSWQDALFDPARDFVSTDSLVIAAPYWDLMFPSILKVYIEHIFIRELTFRYRGDQPIGLCRARRALYLTTAGSPMGDNDFGGAYLRATLSMLGIQRFDSVCAEGLDLQGADVQAIMAAACAKAASLALDW